MSSIPSDDWRLDQAARTDFRLSDALEREHARSNRVLGRAIDAEFRELEGRLVNVADKEARSAIIQRRRRTFDRQFGYQSLSNRMEQTGQKVSRANLAQYRKVVRQSDLTPEEKTQALRGLSRSSTDRDVRTWRANLVSRMRRRTGQEFQVLENRVNEVEESDAIRSRVKARRKQVLENVQLDARADVTNLGRDVTRTRSRVINVDEFRWQSREDSRVRPLHQQINGTVYKYSEGGHSSEGLPGQPFGCRCRAIPVVSSDESEQDA